MRTASAVAIGLLTALVLSGCMGGGSSQGIDKDGPATDAPTQTTTPPATTTSPPPTTSTSQPPTTSTTPTSATTTAPPGGGTSNEPGSVEQVFVIRGANPTPNTGSPAASDPGPPRIDPA